MTHSKSQYDFVNIYYEKKETLIYPTLPVKPLEQNFNKNYRAYAEAMEQYDNDLIEYKNYIEYYHQKDNEWTNEFKISLLEYLGIFNHPKAEKLYGMAWEKGHSEGLDSVAWNAEELSELIV